jgi:hypothetical protein
MLMMNNNHSSDGTRLSEFATGVTPVRTGRGEHASVSRSGIVDLARFLGAILILTALSAPMHAFSANVTLAWTPNTAPNVAGCNLYYGAASGTYTDMVNPGTATSTTISGLVEGRTYYFAATSYDTLGMESDFSNEASYTVPGVFVPVVNVLRTLLTGEVVLDVIGQVGHTYQIQASRLLGGWVTIGAVTVGATGSTEFIDVNGSILPALFYRLVEVFPAKLKLRRLPTKQVVLTVTGQAGRTYSIQASSNLITWTVIGTALVPAGGSLDFTDTNAASYPKRFYRARQTN